MAQEGPGLSVHSVTESMCLGLEFCQAHSQASAFSCVMFGGSKHSLEGWKERLKQTQDLVCKHHSLLRGLTLLGKIAISRAGVDKVHEPGIS